MPAQSLKRCQAGCVQRSPADASGSYVSFSRVTTCLTMTLAGAAVGASSTRDRVTLERVLPPSTPSAGPSRTEPPQAVLRACAAAAMTAEEPLSRDVAIAPLLVPGLAQMTGNAGGKGTFS